MVKLQPGDVVIGTAVVVRPDAVPAEAGLKYTLVYGPEEYTVQASCQGKAGFWVCSTCGESFQNQMQKDIHIGGPSRRKGKLVKGPHILVWVCMEHGAEVP